jgi:hypothetical protein
MKSRSTRITGLVATGACVLALLAVTACNPAKGRGTRPERSDGARPVGVVVILDGSQQPGLHR